MALSVASSGAMAIKMTGLIGKNRLNNDPLPKIKFGNESKSMEGCSVTDLEDVERFSLKRRESRPILLIRRMSNTVMHTVSCEARTLETLFLGSISDIFRRKIYQRLHKKLAFCTARKIRCKNHQK